jgi:hypothetical protein
MIPLDSIINGLMTGFLARMIRRFRLLPNFFQCHPRCLELSLHEERGLTICLIPILKTSASTCWKRSGLSI